MKISPLGRQINEVDNLVRVLGTLYVEKKGKEWQASYVAG